MDPNFPKPENFSGSIKAEDLDFALLDKTQHDRESFDCGNPLLNEFLRKNARQDMARNKSKTMVFFAPNSEEDALKPIIGFFTIVNKPVNVHIDGNEVRSFPNAVLIGRLAIDKKYQGRGLGKGLLETALAILTKPDSKTVVVVDAKDGAIEFYLKYGFRPVSVKELNKLFIIL